MRLVVEPMELEDIPQVLEVDRESYTTPWPASAYRREILHNRSGRYVVLRQIDDDVDDSRSDDESDHKARVPFFPWSRRMDSRGRPGRIIGYAGMWLMIDEAHITTIAVREGYRGRGLGELLLATLVEAATDIGARRMTLEVRVSNESAQNLYRKYGFRQEGVRPRYYSDNNEDAYIMTTGDINDPGYRQTFEEHVSRLRRRLRRDEEGRVESPVLSTAPESTDVGK